MGKDNNIAGTARKEAPRMLSFRDIVPAADEYIKIPLNSRSGAEVVGTGYAVWRMLRPTVLRKYRSIYSGGLNAKKSQPVLANKFLIEQCFVKFDGIECPWKDEGYESEAAWLADSEDGQYNAEFIIGEYLKRATPDTDDIKEL